MLHYTLGAKKIESLLRNPDTSAAQKVFLRRVGSIKRFAVERIGLKDNRNYTSYKKVDRDYLVDVVQAADPLSFTAYEWHYPLLGKLPYRGYYDPAGAEKEAKRLRAKGYDVIVRKVDAFSTLGFLSDPIYSFMQSYSPFELASLIIHEQTHATLFLKGQDQFNEELATFVGEQGALEYLRSTDGVASPAYKHGLAELADNRLFLAFIARLKAALQRVYEGPGPKSEKLREKSRVIAEYERIFARDYRPRFESKQYRAATHLPINNAYIMLFGLYNADISLLARYDRELCGGSLKVFMQHMEGLAKERGPMVPKIVKELSGTAAGRGRRGGSAPERGSQAIGAAAGA